MRQELAFWLAVALISVAAVGTFKIVARGPVGDRFKPVKKLADAI